ncbi:MAG: permease [Rhodospirillaceae bacterium]|nr:permease [Rhodospirillaceae bacterium]MBL6930426.1 permease [Rhodospirillales bacterium]MBL6942345.1 permease [Rhodospirillales bacterium]
MTLGRGINKIDNAVLAIVLIAISIAFGLPRSEALESLYFTADSLLGISPFLIASAAAAAYLSAAGADKVIGRVFSGHGWKVIAMASLFGALSPFCSCGVIPIIAALLAAGVPLPAVMAFWLASPIMDPEMFVLTVGGLSFEFAVAKTLAAIAIGMFGGLATRAVQKAGGFTAPLKAEVSGCGSSCKPQISDEKPLWTYWKDAGRRQDFNSTFMTTVLFLGKWLLLAFMLESLMVMYLPADTVAQWLGNDSTFALPLAVIAGVPAYMNGYAAIPLVSGLMESGMAPGPALAFMTAGAVTSIPAAIAVFALVKRPVFLWYLLLAGTGSLMVGQVFQVYMSL